ncbi:MAG: diguanylate cyclase [Methylococcales bacterium]|jgi:diguanylate cyclase (GGDEF)-like protein|nr:diguanylate cyclase [Methylococcales bacterium]
MVETTKKVEKQVVLLVDDEPANIQVLAACLQDFCQLKVATSGQQALDLALKKPLPDLILLDIEMQDIEGYDVCVQLKNNLTTSNIPIIFVTGKNAEEDEEKGLELGAVDYITKPVSSAIVRARVKTHLTLKHQQDQLKLMALHDHLTKLYNRHYLMDVAEKKIAHSKRHQQPLSLLMMDLDHFKQINDTHGHLVGDRMLQGVAKLLMEQSRLEDVVARFGGEEFVILLDQCDLTGAVEKAQEYCSAVEALKPDGVPVTLSIGAVQLCAEQDNFKDFMKRADDAVYKAKEKGRNCVVGET